VKPLVTVIVPVLGRPQNAGSFMASLLATTAGPCVFAVCNNDADAEPWSAYGAWTSIVQPISYPAKANLVLPLVTTPYVFLTGDDVRFHPGWLKAAALAGSLDTKVVGTNDLGNPRVMAGEHGTHLLIQTSYIRERGASWDGPGVLCHEGYRHWFVDDEIVQVAKQRDVWASATDSIVEHVHPAWGKAPDDNTYALGESFRERDLELFHYRCLKYGAVDA
jgi:hypothetical protein